MSEGAGCEQGRFKAEDRAGTCLFYAQRRPVRLRRSAKGSQLSCRAAGRDKIAAV